MVTHLHLTTLVLIIVRSITLSLLGYIQDITCSVTGIITEVLIMVMTLIIMILSTRVIMDITGQDTGHLIRITLTGGILIIIIPAFIIEIPEGRMMFM